MPGAERPPRRDDAVNAELIERLAQVEERVRVLERIVTDERARALRPDGSVIGGLYAAGNASAAVGDAVSLKTYERFRPESLLDTAVLSGTGWLERFGGLDPRRQSAEHRSP